MPSEAKRRRLRAKLAPGGEVASASHAEQQFTAALAGSPHVQETPDRVSGVGIVVEPGMPFALGLPLTPSRHTYVDLRIRVFSRSSLRRAHAAYGLLLPALSVPLSSHCLRLYNLCPSNPRFGRANNLYFSRVLQGHTTPSREGCARQ